MARRPNVGAKPEVAVGRALGWLVLGLALGVVVLITAPFGQASDVPAEDSGFVLLNGYALALAPLLSIMRAYRAVRAVPVEPRGLEERRVIGGRWMLLSCVVHALGPAAGLIWGGDHRVLFGCSLVALVSLSWLVFIELQRRTRKPLAIASWTSQEIDQLRVNSEVIVIALLWSAVGLSFAGASPSEIPDMPQ
jgi:hypothetical protein